MGGSIREILLAFPQFGARRSTATPACERDLERGIDGLGAGVGEEDAIAPAGSDGEPLGESNAIGCPIWNEGA